MEKVSNKRLKKIIDNHEVISFDIFDTLIKRNCQNPSDIFDIVEKEYNKTHFNKINNFKNTRIIAEQNARKFSDSEEVDINDIYNYMKITVNIKEELKDLEIKTEKYVCQINYNMYDIYDYCKKKNKKVVCTSDMYLDKKTIEEILKKNGYFIEKLYLSSDVGKQKRSGNLFKYMIDDLKVDPRKILHIGDSKRGDYLIPKIFRIDAYLVPRYKKNFLYLNMPNNIDINTNIMYSFVNNNVLPIENDYEKLGYEILGPIVYSFCQWLYIQCKTKKIEKIFFCARDMQFTQKIFNILFKEENIPNEYLYISRKSIEAPYAYVNNNFESFINTITDKKMLFKEILRNKGIYIDNLSELLKKYNIDPNQEYNCHSIDSKKFRNFFDLELKDIINKCAKIQYDNFLDYMKSINFNINTSAIVDLGWKGTIQYSLNKIYKTNSIKGFYLGIENKMFKELNDIAFGYVFSRDRNQDISEKIYSFRSLFEILFSATHGTTIKYTNDSKMRYILGNYENKNIKIIEEIQRGALKFINQFIKYKDYVDKVNILNIMNDFINIGINPTYKQSEIFGDINFENMIMGKIAKPKPLVFYIIHPRELKKDIFKSEWKVGFLKRLLKIKAPYYKCYQVLKKKKGRILSEKN